MLDGISKMFSKVGDKVDRALRDDQVNQWLDKLADAEKREEKFRKQAANCVKVYEADADADESIRSAYNILYANTMTLAPALYNSTPRPAVKPAHKGEQPPHIVYAAKVLHGTLLSLVKRDQPGYSTFDAVQRDAVVEALVPGRGVTRFRYHADMNQRPATVEELARDVSKTTYDEVQQETVCFEEVPWDRIRLGYAKKWPKVPWMAFEHFWTKEECVKNFGKAGEDIQLTAISRETGDKEDKQPVDSQGAQFAHVWEIWDKTSKQVLFISDGARKPIKVVDDPFQLEHFFPVVKPLQLFHKISSMVPKPIYTLYEEQARELNTITMRISGLTKQLKVRGYYDSQLQDMEKLADSPDGTLVPATNSVALSQSGGLDKGIWLLPIDKIVAVLQQLYANRVQAKQTIYEITGVADIMRGSSAASETLGAQKIKETWGTLRLKDMQKEVQRYARDSLRVIAELAGNHFSQETFAKLSGVYLPTQAQKAQVQAAMAQAQQQMQVAQQAQQQPPQELQQMLSQGQAILDLPTWEEVLPILKDDLLRTFTIDIETNSTIDAEATEDREQVTEFMNAMGQLLSGLIPMIEKGMMPFGMAKQFMLAVVQRFRFGIEVEEYIKGMKEPPPQKDPVQAKVEADMQRDQQKFDLDMKKEDAKAQREAQAAEQEMQLEQQRLELERERLNMEREKLQMELMYARAEHQMKMEALQAKAIEKTIPAAAPAQAPGESEGENHADV